MYAGLSARACATLVLPRGGILLLGGLLDGAAAEAEAEAEAESCGLLLGRQRIHRSNAGMDHPGGKISFEVGLITRCKNVARAIKRQHEVELDPGHLVRADRLAQARRLTILGTWHSHPAVAGSLAFSGADRGLLWSGAVALVLVPTLGPRPGLAAWTQMGERIAPVPIRISGARNSPTCQSK